MCIFCGKGHQVKTSLRNGPKDKEFLSSSLAADTAAKSQTSEAGGNIPTDLRKLVYQRDQCCQYQDPVTKRQCGSKLFLETDHKQPRWAGGENSLGNLRLLCSNHNKNKYRKEAFFD